jgi:uncharacterized protein YwgA
MLESTYLLLKLFDTSGKINGRKKLQKTIYLLGNSGLDILFDYEYHYYGPYSAQLQEEVNYLASHDFLKEDYIDSTYTYEITTKGSELVERLEQNSSHNIEINKNLVNGILKENSQFLEMSATYVYLVNSGYNRETAKRKAVELKPQLSYLADKSFTFAESHDLI